MAKKKVELKTTTLTSPAGNVEPWVVEQLSKRPKESWVREQLDGTYNKEVLDLKLASIERDLKHAIDSLKDDAEDTQRIVIEQRGKWSKAPKRHEMEDLKVAVTGWSAWFRRTLVGMLLFLIGTGGVAVWRYAEMSTNMAASLEEMEEVKEENRILQARQREMEKQIEMLISFMKHPDTLNSYRVGPVSDPDNTMQ